MDIKLIHGISTIGSFHKLVKSFLSGIKVQTDIIYNFMVTQHYYLKYNAQKIVLQRYLNDLYDNSQRRIWIRINDRYLVKYKYRAGEAVTNYKYRLSDISGSVFEEESWEDTFENTDLVAGVATFNHSLNIAFPQLTIKDNEGYIVAPSNYEVQITSTNQLKVTFPAPITGTWSVRISNDYYASVGEISGTSIYKYRANESIDYTQDHFTVMVPTGFVYVEQTVRNKINRYVFPWLIYSFEEY